MAELKPDELLVVIVPEARADEVVDFLIGREALSGFTRSAVAGFSRQHSRLSVREAVLGYREQARFEVLGSGELLDGLVRDLAGIAGRDHFRWWRLPLVATGATSAPAGGSGDQAGP
jgi:hypothetical protein